MKKHLILLAALCCMMASAIPASAQLIIRNSGHAEVGTNPSSEDTDSVTVFDVTIKNGIEFEIEASGTVTLQDGFNVEKGATFAVYPSSF